MMENLTAEQVNLLADNFMQMANALGNYRYENIDALTDEENRAIKQLHSEQLTSTTELYTKSAVLVLDDAQAALEQIGSITMDTQELYKKLTNVQNIVDRAGSILNLTSSILALDVQATSNYIQELVS